MALLLWMPAGISVAVESPGKSKVTAKKQASVKAAAARAKVVKAKSRNAKAGVKRTSKAKSDTRTVHAALRTESDLQREISSARALLARNPQDREAKERLADTAIATVDLLLAAEAVGNTNKAERLVKSLHRDLSDVGSRVQRRAQTGESSARQALGYFYAKGFAIPRDTVKSCTEFKAAAEHHAASAWQSAQCVFDTRADDAWGDIERAGGMGHAIAQEWLGRRCLGELGAVKTDFVCARDWLGRSASQGRPKAQTLLAYLFNSGQGGPVDASRALRLYKLAAEQGDADAQNNVGEMFETGRGVENNLGEAIQWYERAAERGLAVAQFNAGRLWAIGVDEKTDPARARAWLVQAEAKGIVQARQVLEWLDNESIRSAGADTKEAAPVESKSK